MGKTAVGVFFMLCYAVLVASLIASMGMKYLGESILLNLVLVGGAMFVVYRTSKPKANEVRDQVIEDYHEALELLDDEDKAKAIKALKMLKALDNPIRLKIVNFILSKQGEQNEYV